MYGSVKVGLSTYAKRKCKSKLVMVRVGINSGIERELSSIPDSIPGIELGIGIKKKELELNWN